MLEPILVDRAAFFPNRAIDGTSEGPFIDTHIEHGGGQRIYLTRRHARSVGLATGLLVDIEELRHATTALNAAMEQIAQLEADVEAARGAQVVSLADVKELVRQRGGRPPTRTA